VATRVLRGLKFFDDVFPNTFMELLMKQCSESDTDNLKGQLLAKQMVS